MAPAQPTSASCVTLERLFLLTVMLERVSELQTSLALERQVLLDSCTLAGATDCSAPAVLGASAKCMRYILVIETTVSIAALPLYGVMSDLLKARGRGAPSLV